MIIVFMILALGIGLVYGMSGIELTLSLIHI